MSTADAARAYVDAWTNPDPTRRAESMARYFHAEGRIVGGVMLYDGRAAVLAAMGGARASDVRKPRVRLTSPIDVQGRLFRLRAIIDLPDGTVLAEATDIGEVDAAGRIVCIYTMRDGPA